MHRHACRRSVLFSWVFPFWRVCSRFGEKIEQIVPRDQGYLFPIRTRDQKLLGKKLTIPKHPSAGAVLPRQRQTPVWTIAGATMATTGCPPVANTVERAA